jgi:hypothetical protein
MSTAARYKAPSTVSGLECASDPCNARIKPLADRIQPCLPGQHRTDATRRSRQEIPSGYHGN